LYSQSSIANKFIKGDHGQIGEVLDDIMEDRFPISKLPTIEVKCIDGRYVSCDNRRLWILKQLERLGRVNQVSVKPVLNRNTIPYSIKVETVHLETDLIYIINIFKSPNSTRTMDTANFHIVGPS
jgi:hypothetical protein